MALDFNSLHVVVTGGTGALGTAVVEQLVDQGATCHIPCFSESELAKFPYKSSDRVRIVAGVNLTDEQSTVDFYRQFGDTGGGPRLWASVHVAGGFAYAPIDTVTGQDFRAQWEMNVLTAFLCSREAVRAMRGQGGAGGRIVNTASRPGLVPALGANMTAYTSAKAAVCALTESLAAEVAPEGIWVNAVAPSIMDTPANRAAMPKADYSTWPKVHEVARTICFLASPMNQTTRGAVVSAYGRA
ncbi:MAG TPA: SDR family NAD(P)-dependent oxidoreductase [Phycisphaerales bacterium]|nr:SDR family NAD(P)-dependent oxidoreductase [Phycisphaerales bacterium]